MLALYQNMFNILQKNVIILTYVNFMPKWPILSTVEPVQNIIYFFIFLHLKNTKMQEIALELHCIPVLHEFFPFGW